MNTIETIKLDRVPKGKMPVLHASQYDNGRTHGIDLTNLGEEWKLDGTETLTINERKVDNNICSMDIENTFVGSNHIVFASTEQMCACAGSNFCELRISKGDVDLGTLNFILEVEPDPTADGIESESEIRNLKTQIEDITEEVIGDDYYTKTQTDEAIANATDDKADTTYVNTELAKKADKSNTYTKTQVDDKLSEKANADDVYQKTETYSKTETDNLVSPKADKTYVDTQLQAKANASDVYTKSQTDNLLNDKADVTDLPDMSQYYDKSEVDDLLDDKANSDDVYGKAYIDTALSGKANVGTSYTKSEEDALLANKADKSGTYTKEQVDDIAYGILPDDTASGAIANFDTSLELPLKSLEVDVNAVQSAGTPTPASPLPIEGWDAITLDVNGNTEVINLGGTYYGGHFTQDKAGHRQFEVTHNIVDLGSLNWVVGATDTQGTYRMQSSDIASVIKKPALSTQIASWVKCEAYETKDLNSVYLKNMGIAVASSGNIAVYDSNYNTISSPATFKQSVQGVMFVYELENPTQVIDLPDGEPIITLNGTNNIYADTGDTSVVFKDSVNGYVEKKIASVQALTLNT